MPWRLDEFTAKVQFTTAAKIPHLIFQAVVKTDCLSNSVYMRNAVCEALSRDLGIPLQELLDMQPTPRGKSATRWTGDRKHYPGPNDTPQTVK